MRLPRIDGRELAAIYAGGVLGALARVGLAEAAPHGVDGWPWATFAANLAGALLLGYFVTRLQERLPPVELPAAVARHRPLRRADDLRHAAAGAVRHARRRRTSASPSPTWRRRSPAASPASTWRPRRCGGRGWCDERLPPGSASPCSAGSARWPASCSTRRSPSAPPAPSRSGRWPSTSAAPSRSGSSPASPCTARR